MPGVALPRAFWWLWTSTTVSNLADGVLKTALPLVAVGWTRSPAAVAGVALALSLPWLVVSLPAGALVDRWDRRRTLVVADLARAAVLALLTAAVATGTESLALLYAVAVLVGVAEVFRDTTAQSVLPQVVGRDALPAANGRLHAAELTANVFAGPPLGGLLVGAGALGATFALGVPAGLWVLAAVGMLRLRGSYRVRGTDGPRTTVRGDIAEGLLFLVRHRVLRSLAVMVGVANLASSATGAVLVLWAVGPASAMGLTEAQYGLLLTAMAVGAVAGSLVATRVAARLGRTATLAVTILTSTLSLGAPALTTDAWLVAGANVLAGFGIAVWNVVTVSLRQQLTPDALLGRVNSAYRLLAWGTVPLGAGLGGLVGEAWGLRWVFVGAAVVSLTMLALLRLVREAREPLAAAAGAAAAEADRA